MRIATEIAVGFVALIHIYILILEMFLWNKPAGLRAFGLTQALADQTKVLAANQGLYNGFLAAGLIYGLLIGTAGEPFKIFFLVCVIVAGVYGAATVNRRILIVQSVPAAVALALVLLSGR